MVNDFESLSCTQMEQWPIFHMDAITKKWGWQMGYGQHISAPSLNHSQFLITGIKRYSCGGNWDKHPEFHPKTSHVLRWFIEHKWAGYCLFFSGQQRPKTNPMILVPFSSCQQRCLVILLAHIYPPERLGSKCSRRLEFWNVRNDQSRKPQSTPC